MLKTLTSAALFAALVVAANAAVAFSVEQIFRPERNSRGDVNLFPLQPADDAAWIWLDGVGTAVGDFTPFVRFRREFSADGATPLEIDVSADARYILYLDGEEISRGPHHGLPTHWYYQSYRITDISPGRHVFEALVFTLGEKGPLCILSSGRGGFMLKAGGAYDSRLTTGKAPWLAAEITNVRYTQRSDPQTMTGARSYSSGSGCTAARPQKPWRRASVVKAPVRGNEYGFPRPGWALFPTGRKDTMRVFRKAGTFRAAHSREEGWYEQGDAENSYVKSMNALLADGTEVTIPSNTSVRLLWDLGDYYSAYPLLVTSKGKNARIRWAWTEGLYDRENTRRNRDAFAGKRLYRTMDDFFLPDGRNSAEFTTAWWRSGRWVELTVETAGENVILNRIGIIETRSPMEPSAEFECSDPSIAAVRKICIRGLQNCMHEMFMDCPYFEQQMYPGDTRVQMLILNSINGDDRMIRYGMEIFDYGRRDNALVPMNFPSRNIQDSSTYSMCWAMMFGDYVRWHGANDWLKSRMPGLRHTLHLFSMYENADGLVTGLPGWNFMDWVPEWDRYGNAPDGRKGLSAVNNLIYAHALLSAAKAEAAVGEKTLSEYWRAKADRVRRSVMDKFWSEKRCLIADTTAKDRFSEHAQCLALLAGAVPAEKEAAVFANLTKADDLARTTVYFSHYLFETYLKFKRADLVLKRLDLWREYVADGLKTPLEAPGRRGRSDCHAWGSHPLYHLQTGIAGIRPAADGFAAVEIAPQPGTLEWIKASSPTPKGMVSIDLKFGGGGVEGTVTVPSGLPAVFVWNDERGVLAAGENRISINPATSR